MQPLAEQKAVWDFQDLTWSPDGQHIAFTGIVDRKYRIYQIAAKPGSKPSPLFEVEGNQLSPTWSPDGRKIAFGVSQQGSHAIYVASANGKNPTKISDDGMTPSWSPDGAKIAFTAKRDGGKQICSGRDDVGLRRWRVPKSV